MLTYFISKNLQYRVTNCIKLNKNKQLLSIKKINNNIKDISIHKSIQSKPFNFSKKNYYTNPGKPPQDDIIFYIVFGCITYIYINKPPSSPSNNL
jgi:hypothetical protein